MQPPNKWNRPCVSRAEAGRQRGFRRLNAADPNPAGAAPGEQIVLVGASVRAAAQSARRSGYRVIGVDLYGDTDTLAACDRHFLIDARGDRRRAESRQVIDVCNGLPIFLVGGLASDHPLVEALLPVRRGENGLRDFGKLREIAKQCGMGFPESHTAIDPPEHEMRRPEKRWLWKQRDSCGGLGIAWHRPMIHRPKSAVGTAVTGYHQRWVPGRAFGATMIGDGTRGRLLGVCRALFTRMPDRPFVYAGSFGPIGVTDQQADLLRSVAQDLASKIGLRGVFNVDYIRDRSGKLWMLEVNPRWSGSMELIERSLVEQSRIDSLMGLAIEARRKRLPAGWIDPAHDRNGAGGVVYLKRVLFAPARCLFQREVCEALLSEDATIHDVPPEGSVIERGRPICTVIRRVGPNEKDPMHRHRVLMKRLKAEAIDRIER